MNRKSIIRMGWWLASAAMVMLAASTYADTPAFVLGNISGPPSSFTGTCGWEFGRLGSSTNDILVTQLGIFDSGSDGLVNSHEVGLWRSDPGGQTGTLLASATVPAGDTAVLLGGYRWVEISPVVIPRALAFYTVGAHFVEGDLDNLAQPNPAGFAPNFGPLYANGRFADGPDLAYPYIYTSSPEGQLGERFFQANFQYVVVPEPATWMLLSSAALFFLVRRRDRS